jgi:hypothetical protein
MKPLSRILFKPFVLYLGLHYGHALFMLIGFAVFRPSMVGKALIWWDIAFVLAFYHHFEHALLLGQRLFNQNLFNSPVPISIGQI